MKNTRILVAMLTANLLSTATFAYADQTESYGETFGRKLTSSFANISTSVLEIPKNIIIDSNQSNILYGLAGGTMEGVIHTLGRVSTGILDLVTAPIPTKPSVYPLYIWDDFDAQTTYGPILRMQNQ